MNTQRLNAKRFITGLSLSAALVSGAAWAQSASSSNSLNLSLPSGNLPAVASSSAAAAKSSNVSKTSPSTTAQAQASQGQNGTYYGDHSNTSDPQKAPQVTSGVPGVYYGDHSNTTNVGVAEQNTPHCDDATYNNTQVHGSVDMGVVSGSHTGTGSYTGGAVTLTKAFGDCNHPTGGVSISIGGTQFNQNGGGPGHGEHW